MSVDINYEFHVQIEKHQVGAATKAVVPKELDQLTLAEYLGRYLFTGGDNVIQGEDGAVLLTGFSYQTWRQEQDEALQALAPFARGQIDYQLVGEDTPPGRWIFRNGKVKEECAQTVWPDDEAARAHEAVKEIIRGWPSALVDPAHALQTIHAALRKHGFTVDD
jgi:hypothetical protein